MNTTEPHPKTDQSLVQQANQESKRVQELIEQIEAMPDPDARDLATECIQSLLSLYGHGLQRVLEVAQKVEGGQKVYDALIRDKIVCGLLLVHGLHPTDLPTRLLRALDTVRPYMESHGGNVELTSLENGVAKLRLQGSCKGCPSSAVTLELAVRRAIEEACPDLLGFEVEGAVAPEAKTCPTPESPARDWVTVESAQGLRNGEFVALQVAGVPTFLCKVNEQYYAYSDRCPTCDTPLHTGTLQANVLTCQTRHSYDVQQAGRAIEDSNTHLAPFPLLVEDGEVKILPQSGPGNEIQSPASQR